MWFEKLNVQQRIRERIRMSLLDQNRSKRLILSRYIES